MTTTYLTTLNQISELYSDLQGQIRMLTFEIKKLETLPRVNGHEWMKDGKYLYIVHHDEPSNNGGGRKEYVGADPEKQAEARASLERFKEWEAKQAERSRLRRKLTRADHFLVQAKDILSFVGS